MAIIPKVVHQNILVNNFKRTNSENPFNKYFLLISDYFNYLKSIYYQTLILEKNLTKIKGSLLKNNEKAIDELVDIHISLSIKNNYRSKIIFKNFINDLCLNDLDFFLKKLIIKKLNSNNKKVFDLALEMLDFEKLKLLISHSKKSVLKDIAALKEKAIDIANIANKKNLSSDISKFNEKKIFNLDSTRLYIANFIHNFWSTFMKANDFTIDDPPATSRWEAQSRLSTFYQLFYYPLQSFIAIKNALLKLSIVWWLPYIGSTLIIASILSGLKLFDYWFSSNTIHFQNNYKNLSESAQLKEIDAVIGRQNEINKVVNLLGILKSSSLTPLLIGKTGIGKSAIVKSLAKDIHDGKYPHLKNKQIIEINTSELHDQGSYNWGLYKSRLDILLKEIKGKEDKVILFLDEIHRIIKDPKDPDTFDLADRLKTILSEKKVNIIGATTIEEYNKHIKPFKALERRFEKIELDELSDNDHILALKTHVFNKFKDKTVENDAINLSLKLAKKNKDVATIANALIILDTCNNYLNTYKTLEENELSKLEDILKKLKNEYFLDKNKSIFSKETNIKINEIKKIEKKIKTLKERISKNNQSIKNLKDLQHKKNYYNQEFINYAHALKDLAFKDKNFSTIAKNFLFLSEYLLDVLNDLIKTKEDELNKKNIKTKIDVDLVEMLQLNSAQKKESRFYFLNFF